MASSRHLQVVGIDGAPGGWVAAVVRAGRIAALEYHATVAEIVAAHPRATTFGIDIPLSFPDGCEHREADKVAKEALGPMASSLFYVPPRDVLNKKDYAAANSHSKKHYDRGISRQAHALRTKIFDAVDHIERTGERRLWEVHPELSFQHLAKEQGRTLSSRKKTWNGFFERYTLLETVGLAPPLQPAPSLGKTAPDDVLDACVAAWSALRIANGTAVPFPPPHRGGASRSGVILA